MLRPGCSYTGGEPGFVRVLDEHTVAFSNYDGNGMYLSVGNVLNRHLGYIHRMAVVERSRFVPRDGVETPVPEWKRADWACDVLPRRDAKAGRKP